MNAGGIVMIRIMSLLFTFFLFFMTAAMTVANNSPPSRTPSSPVKSPDSNLNLTPTPESESLRPSDLVSDRNLEERSNEMLQDTQNSETILRLSWAMVPNAVKYKVTFNDEEYITCINGIEVKVNSVEQTFKITALDLYNNVIRDDISVLETEVNPFMMRTTTEFDKMDYAPLYPVYSWVPKYNADYYLIQLLKDGEIVRSYQTREKDEDEIYDFYDYQPIDEAGEYYWRVKAMSKYGFALSEWSEQTEANSFTVTAPTKYAAFGDSITHGGGAISVPPSVAMYNWETYCSIPIKNLAKSGDTTEQLINRFDNDVLSFAPKILIIMAGVNDFRANTIGWETICNYKILAEKCKDNGIIPVFITPTPINPDLIKKAKLIERPPSDWQTHYDYACEWIRKQEYFIDITADFEDEEGNLRADLTTDGLHPDMEGKKIIGQAVQEWFYQNNPDV